MGDTFFTGIHFPLFILYITVTLIVSFQIGRILYNKHNIFSFRFGFLVLGFVWGLTRSVFWCFFDFWSYIPFTIFFYIPINIQFATFSLLVLFYAHVVHRATWERITRKRFTIAYLSVNIILLILQILWIGLSCKYFSDDNDSKKDELMNQIQSTLNGIVFLLLVSILAFYGWRLRVIMQTTKSHLQSQLPLSIIPITFFIFLCFTSRCIFDFFAAFGAIQIQLDSGTIKNNITIFVTYLVWEILPYILILVLFWRIPTTHIGGLSRKGKNVNSFAYPPQTAVIPGKAVQQSQPSGNLARLFLDPQRYDSDDETTSLLYKGSPVLYSGHHSPYSTTPLNGDNSSSSIASNCSATVQSTSSLVVSASTIPNLLAASSLVATSTPNLVSASTTRNLLEESTPNLLAASTPNLVAASTTSLVVAASTPNLVAASTTPNLVEASTNGNGSV